MMLQRWTDHTDTEHRVLDDYERNRVLVDLTAQPADIREQIAQTIATAQAEPNRTQIGTHFLKFCGKYDLKKISDNSVIWGQILSAGPEQK